MAKANFKNGLTSNKIRVFIPDTTSVIGGGKTGLTSSSVGLTISTIADNEASATTYTQAGSTIETITTLGTFAAPTATKCRFKEVDATNHPGLYEIQIADARFAVSGARMLHVTLPAVSGLGTGLARAEIQLEAIDNQDAVRAGLTALPNAAAEAAGGLFTRGTGAGQINQDANGRIDVNLKAILNTILTETAGQIAAGFKKLFDVASPVFTLLSIVQTGDSYGRIGAPVGASVSADIAATKVDTAAIKAKSDQLVFTVANQIDSNVIGWKGSTAPAMTGDAFARLGAPAGASVSADMAAVQADTAASQTSESTLLSRLSSARAGYMDNLNIGGNVAGSSEVTSIQNNTRVVRVVPDFFERPDSGTTVFRIELLIYDEVGNMEAPDSAPTISVVNEGGTSRDSNLDSTTMSVVSTGRYRSTYTMDSAHALEQLIMAFSVIEGGATRVYANTGVVVDTTAVDFTSTDRTNLGAIKSQTDLLAFTSGKVDSQVRGMDTDVLTAAALKADAVTKAQNGLMTSAGYTAPPTVGANADAVWDEILSGHTTTGSAGKELADSAAGAGEGATAAEVWAYGSRTLTANGRVTIISPYSATTGVIFLVKGDSYNTRPIVFEDGGNWPDLTDSVVKLKVFDGVNSLFEFTGTVVDGDPVIVNLPLTLTQTGELNKSNGRYSYQLVATISGLVYTLAFGGIAVVE